MGHTPQNVDGRHRWPRIYLLDDEGTRQCLVVRPDGLLEFEAGPHLRRQEENRRPYRDRF